MVCETADGVLNTGQSLRRVDSARRVSYNESDGVMPALAAKANERMWKGRNELLPVRVGTAAGLAGSSGVEDPHSHRSQPVGPAFFSSSTAPNSVRPPKLRLSAAARAGCAIASAGGDVD